MESIKQLYELLRAICKIWVHPQLNSIFFGCWTSALELRELCEKQYLSVGTVLLTGTNYESTLGIFF